MTEVFSLIDNPTSLLIFNHSQAAGEEEEENEIDDDISMTETPVQTPTVSSPNSSMFSESFGHGMNGRGNCNRTEQEDRRTVRTPDVSSGSPLKEEPVMEAERFQRAADVLARHYGGGSFTKGTRTVSNKTSPGSYKNHKTSYALSEEEEEIKV